MIITTSRRPDHRTRILCRELTWVIPNSRYLPRGTKTVEGLSSIARESGHNRIMLVGSAGGGPTELRFLDVGENWRWVNARVKLGEVKLQREGGRRIKLKGLKICGEGPKALGFAAWFGQLLGLDASERPPASGGVALVTSEDGLKLQFLIKDNSEAVGPVLQVLGFGNLNEECVGGNGES